MNQFPENLTPSNLNNDYIDNNLKIYYLSLLRNEIYLHILKSDDMKDFFSLEDFFNNHSIRQKYRSGITSSVIDELVKLNWSVKKLFNDTAILICKSEENATKSIWSQSIE